jgi:GT2 family glycosyltransferase
VSIISPSLNQARYIGEMMTSVRRQTYPHVEHIIVDGGSTDSTLEEIESLQDAYDVRWLIEIDTGMYAAINKGLRMAQGDILAYLNTDDRYWPWTIATVVNAFELRPEASFVFGDMINVQEEAEAVELLLYPPFRFGYVSRFGFLGQPTVFWRRCVFDETGGFDESLRFVADCDYWLRIGKRYRGYKIDEVLAIERDHGAAKRFTHTTAVQEELQRVRAKHGAAHTGSALVSPRIDRMHALVWRRWLLARFVMSWLRRRRKAIEPSQPWASFLNGAWPVELSFGRLIASALPGSLAGSGRGMIKLGGTIEP